MSDSSRFPVTDSEFSAYINRAITHLNTNKQRLVLTAGSQTALTTVTASLNTADPNWNAVFTKYQNGTTDPSYLTGQKNTLRKDIEKNLRYIFKEIPESVLLAMDRTILNLPESSNTYTPAPKPKSSPTISIRKRGTLSVTLAMIDMERPQSAAKPEGVDAIQIEGAYLAPGKEIPENFPQEEDFRSVDIVGRTSYERKYKPDQMRGTEYLRARYLNSRKEAGSWSSYCMVVIA